MSNFKKNRSALQDLTGFPIFFLWLGVFLLLTACATSLETYKPNSPEEAAVRNFLMTAEAAWNQQDAAAFAALLDRHSTFSLQKDGKVVDKENFVKHLPQKMKTTRWDFGPPTIKFRDRKAFVHLALKTDPKKPVVFFTLQKRDGRWRILAIR